MVLCGNLTVFLQLNFNIHVFYFKTIENINTATSSLTPKIKRTCSVSIRQYFESGQMKRRSTPTTKCQQLCTPSPCLFFFFFLFWGLWAIRFMPMYFAYTSIEGLSRMFQRISVNSWCGLQVLINRSAGQSYQEVTSLTNLPW